MVNYQLLQEHIKNKGIKKRKLAELLGLSPEGFYKKLKGIHAFTVTEAGILRTALQMTNEEFDDVFFCDKCCQNNSKKTAEKDNK